MVHMLWGVWTQGYTPDARRWFLPSAG